MSRTIFVHSKFLFSKTAVQPMCWKKRIEIRRRKSLAQLQFHPLNLNRSTFSFPTTFIAICSLQSRVKKKSISSIRDETFAQVAFMIINYVPLNPSNSSLKNRSLNVTGDRWRPETHLHTLFRSRRRPRLLDRSHSRSRRRPQVAGCTLQRSPPGLPRIPLARSDMRRRWSPCS